MRKERPKQNSCLFMLYSLLLIFVHLKIQILSTVFILEDIKLPVGGQVGACSRSLTLQKPPAKKKKDEMLPFLRLKLRKEETAFLGRVISVPRSVIEAVRA